MRASCLCFFVPILLLVYLNVFDHKRFACCQKEADEEGYALFISQFPQLTWYKMQNENEDVHAQHHGAVRVGQVPHPLMRDRDI